ncbi:hypothetical protein [Mycolicibacterium hippocampi]|uniref:Protein kinase n=1 Tax=Mycolicibacterium hippocampi TaxID=659824 RepID=A0A7I9ZUK9_9MYCO|nr:hypothetical protein [Mycolicibacterium hippocampi]GFH04751.1 hypothetical protein MHIP_52340 [Mycolicibacterium hippocampi]
MPTSTEPAEDTAAPRRGLLSAKASAISIVVASFATLVIVFGILSSPGDEPPQVQSIPAQPNTASQWVAAPPEPSTRAPEPPAQPAPLTMDAQGFVDSPARCDEQQQAVAIARTNRSAMVVCRGSDGAYEYQGIRLHDGASLRLDDVRVLPAGFEARNDNTTYRLSPTELVVINGEALQSRDAMVEYRAG